MLTVNVKKSFISRIIVSICFCLLFVVSQSESASERIIVDGVLIITIDQQGNITEAKLVMEYETIEVLNIVLNENGKKLAREMQGIWVQIIWNLFVKDDEYWIDVESYQKYLDYF